MLKGFHNVFVERSTTNLSLGSVTGESGIEKRSRASNFPYIFGLSIFPLDLCRQQPQIASMRKWWLLSTVWATMGVAVSATWASTNTSLLTSCFDVPHGIRGLERDTILLLIRYLALEETQHLIGIDSTQLKKLVGAKHYWPWAINGGMRITCRQNIDRPLKDRKWDISVTLAWGKGRMDDKYTDFSTTTEETVVLEGHNATLLEKLFRAKPVVNTLRFWIPIGSTFFIDNCKLGQLITTLNNVLSKTGKRYFYRLEVEIADKNSDEFNGSFLTVILIGNYIEMVPTNYEELCQNGQTVANGNN
jgi:hypothetical protein